MSVLVKMPMVSDLNIATVVNSSNHTIYTWNHDMEKLYTLLTLYEGKIAVTGGFPSQSISDVEF